MNWVAVIWSATAGICLAFGVVHLLVWMHSRSLRTHLLFGIAACSGALMAVFELNLMYSKTPEQYGQALRLLHIPTGVVVISFVWFVRSYLEAGRRWLVWLVCGLRIITLVLTFSLTPNLNFREITGLREIHALGETLVVAIGEKNPWTNITNASAALFLIFVLDASVTSWRRGARRRALVVGVTFGVVIFLALVASELFNRSLLPIPLTASLLLLIILSGIAYELGIDLARTSAISRELYESQERMKLATDAANLGVWEWDIGRDEIWVTETIRSRLGLGDTERITLDRFLQSLHPEDREPTHAALRQALKGASAFQAEYRSMSAGGDTRWIAARGRIERGNDGAPLRVRGVSVDITEQKQAEADRERLQGELAHVSRVSTMGQLSTALAHELNQPLGAILSNAEAAEMLLDADPPALNQVREILADIRRDDERAGEVIRRMRALLRREEMEMAPLDMGILIQEILRLVETDAAIRKVSLRLAAGSSPLPVRGDRVHLQQVMLNLLVNAMDAVAENRQDESRVVVWAGRNQGGDIEVAVSDNGPGIPPNQLARLFEPFFSTKPHGMGIGTAIARTIIQAHQGRIWAENNPTGGATLRFTLPIDERAESEQNPTLPKVAEPMEKHT